MAWWISENAYGIDTNCYDRGDVERMGKVIFGSACMISSMIGLIIFFSLMPRTVGLFNFLFVCITVFLCIEWIFGFVLGFTSLRNKENDKEEKPGIGVLIKNDEK